MILVRRETRLLLVAVRAISRRAFPRRALPALARLYDLLVTGGSPVQNRFLGGAEVHRAERAEVRRRPRDRHLSALHCLVVGDMTAELMTLQRDEAAHDLGAHVATYTQLIVVGRGAARDVSGLPGVQSQLQVVAKSPIAAVAG